MGDGWSMSPFRAGTTRRRGRRAEGDKVGSGHFELKVPEGHLNGTDCSRPLDSWPEARGQLGTRESPVCMGVKPQEREYVQVLEIPGLGQNLRSTRGRARRSSKEF